MKKTNSFLSLIIAIFLSSCGANSQKGNSDTAKMNPQIAASVDGEELFKANCTMCHGEDGKAGTMGAADLATSKIDHTTAIAIIKSGKNSMSAFSGTLNDAQIDAVATYIEKLRK